MKNPSAALQLFKFSTAQDLLSDDELRVYDNYFCDHEYNLPDQIQIVEAFADHQKKGVFVEIFK